MIYVFNKDETFVALLDNDSLGACPFYNPDEHEILNGEHTFTFTVPGDHDDAKRIQERGFVAVKDEDERFSLFLITELEESHSSSFELRVSCESASVELLDDMIEALSFETLDIQLGAEKILEGTRWEVGTIQGTRSRSLDLEYVTVLEALKQLIETYEFDVRFRVLITGSKIERRYIDFYETRGSETGKRIEFEKDLQSIRRTIDASNIKTAIYPIGKEYQLYPDDPERDETARLTIENVEWSTPDNPLNKPMGEKILLDPEALEKWGRPENDGTKRHNILILESTAEDPVNLLNFAYRTLEEYRDPLIEYDIAVLDLAEATSAPHERVRLGDIVYIIDHDLDMILATRVIEKRRNMLEPLSHSYVCGNVLPDFTNKLRDEINRVESGLREAMNDVSFDDSGLLKEGQTIKTEWLEDEIRLGNKRLTSGGGTVHITETDGILITDKESIADSTSAIRLVSGMLGIASEKNPDGSFNFRSFGTAEGFLGDLAKFGHITFNNARGGSLQLGGIDNQNGVLILYDTSGEEIATLSGDYGGFDRLRIDVLRDTRNVVFKTFDDFFSDNLSGGSIVFYVDAMNGSDENPGTFSEPRQTVQTIIDMLPKYLNHDVYIRYMTNLLRDETISIDGFTGTGKIVLEKWDITIRYIRDWANGSTSNTSNHWIDLALRTDSGYYAHANGEDVVAGVHKNLLTADQSSFETSMTGTRHFASNGLVTNGNRTNSRGATHGYYARWVQYRDAGTSEYMAISTDDEKAPCRENQEYVFSCDVLQNGGKSFRLCAKFYDGNGVLLLVTYSPLYSIATAYEWSAHAFWTTSPPGSRTMAFEVRMYGVVDYDLMYVDSLMIAEGTQKQAFLEGGSSLWTSNLGRGSNGVITSGDYADLGTNNGKPAYIDIYTRGGYTNGKWVEVYHHWSNGRTYHGTKTEVSADRQKWYTVFDSTRQGEYAETEGGKRHTVKHATLNGVLYVRSNSIRVEIRNLMINGMNADVYPMNLEYNQFVLIVDVVSFANPEVSFNMQVVGGRAQVLNSEFNGAKTALIASRGGSTVEAIDTVGGDAPHVFNARGSLIIGAGTAPRGLSGLSNNTGGGETFGSFVQTLGEWTATRIVERTKTWYSKSSASFDHSLGEWRTTHSDVLQGKYSSWGLYRGCWFFGDDIALAVAGKKVKRVRVFVTRANSSGNTNDSYLEVRTHNHATRPNLTTPPTQSGTEKTVQIDRGESMWIDVTSQFASAFEAGTARGIGIYTTSGNMDRYIRMTGSARIEITYDDEE